MPCPSNAEFSGAGEADGQRAGGFRSQPLPLKVLLFASLAAVTIGVVRCSFEATTPLEANVSVVGVAPVTARISPGLLDAPVDTVAARIGSRFASDLARSAGLDVVGVGDERTAVDAVVFLRLREYGDDLGLEGEITERPGGRLLGAISVRGDPALLDELVELAVEQARSRLESSGAIADSL